MSNAFGVTWECINGRHMLFIYVGVFVCFHFLTNAYSFSNAHSVTVCECWFFWMSVLQVARGENICQCVWAYDVDMYQTELTPACVCFYVQVGYHITSVDTYSNVFLIFFVFFYFSIYIDIILDALLVDISKFISFFFFLTLFCLIFCFSLVCSNVYKLYL